MNRNKINAADFEYELQYNDVANLELTQDVVNQFRSGSSQDQRKIVNCKFSKIIFPKFSFRTLTFTDCEIDQIEFRSETYNLLHFSNCNIKELIITDGFRSRKVSIADKSIIGSINADLIESIEFHIDESIFNTLLINGIRNGNSIKIDGAKGESHKFQSALFKGRIDNVDITGVAIESISFKELEGASNLNLKRAISELLDTEGVMSAIRLTSSRLKKISANHIEALDIHGGSIGSLHYKVGRNLKVSSVDDQGVDEKSKIGLLDLAKHSGLTNLDLSNSDLETLKLNSTSVTNCSINGVSISKGLELENVEISVGKFSNIDLEKASIRFVNSRLTGSEITNVRWPKGYEFYEYRVELKQKSVQDKLVTLWALKEGYRQMKVLSLAQHNKVDALYFQKQELKVFWFITKLKTLHESFFQNIGNWFILGTNRLFSDFGQNIWRPLIALFTSHLIWFSILLVTRFDIYPSWPPWNFDSETTRHAVNSFFVSILPTHSFDLTIGAMENIYIGGSIDFLMRVSSGYFIFYFVYSSRKFHQ